MPTFPATAAASTSQRTSTPSPRAARASRRLTPTPPFAPPPAPRSSPAAINTACASGSRNHVRDGRVIGLAARASHPSVVAQEGRLQHHADRQMAPRPASQVRPAPQRLRSLLGISRRRSSTTSRTNAASRPPTPTTSGTMTFPSIRPAIMTELLGDRAVKVDHRLRHREAALLREPPLQRSALAVGRAR